MKNDHLLTKFINKANWSRQVHKLILGPEALGYWSFDKEKSVKGEKYQESKKGEEDYQLVRGGEEK